MKEITVTNLCKSYGSKTLIENVNFSIRTGDRIGLIGPNGTGKSSLLKVLAGKDNYDAGTISQSKNYEIAYLEQNPQLNPAQTVLEAVYESSAPLIQLLLKYEQIRLSLELDPNNPQLQETFTSISEEMTLKGAWDIEIVAKTILTQLKIFDMNHLVGSCSGGQKKRIGLAQVLIAEPDLLILDEPTNHLDIQTIQWLEKHLANYKGALLLVTHDRYFLERSVNKIFELRQGLLREYEGNYQTYLTKRAEEFEIQEKVLQKQDRLYQQELAWMRQGARARTTKQQARIDRFKDLKHDIANRKQEEGEIAFDFGQQRIGNQIMELENIKINIANKVVIEDFSKVFIKGDRLGIVGDNGVGKSTFLNMLAGYHSIDQGIYKVGQTVRIAYYRQLDEDLPDNMRVLNFLTQVADDFEQTDGSKVSASQMLERFNFPRETHGSFISSLSGGERRRLYLLTLLIQEPNVLLLDEPTNDLDIDTLTTLEDYLAEFLGVVVIVSHDRYFLDKTVDQILELTGQGNYQFYWGNYSDFLEEKSALSNIVHLDLKSQSVINKSQKKHNKRMSYQEKKEWAVIQKNIEEMESKIDKINKEMMQSANNAVALMTLQEELDESEANLLELYERYEYLSNLDQ
ncbi:ABC-F family ATP-binding cassette domain-containing protein [Facklamia sp. DSM 111018]|uniref:ABC-F family ATP-binding cassette domain-containing protein n=1 Tax=Facklamia lactis TaxID=2749967 RepID=A0ABS0LMD7_9LACT|nr:ABC-F family ATP-binding cassette domain-containing protein [Facklamia lactis]MBG9985326.1 ABC-F family ATP-binding cassette domain-containing protein [Facklamia lactis]